MSDRDAYVLNASPWGCSGSSSSSCCLRTTACHRGPLHGLLSCAFKFSIVMSVSVSCVILRPCGKSNTENAFYSIVFYAFYSENSWPRLVFVTDHFRYWFCINGVRNWVNFDKGKCLRCYRSSFSEFAQFLTILLQFGLVTIANFKLLRRIWTASKTVVKTRMHFLFNRLIESLAGNGNINSTRSNEQRCRKTSSKKTYIKLDKTCFSRHLNYRIRSTNWRMSLG